MKVKRLSADTLIEIDAALFRQTVCEQRVGGGDREYGEQHAACRWSRGPGAARRAIHQQAETAVFERVRKLVAQRELPRHVQPGLRAEREDQRDVSEHDQPARLEPAHGAQALGCARQRGPPLVRGWAGAPANRMKHAAAIDRRTQRTGVRMHEVIMRP